MDGAKSFEFALNIFEIAFRSLKRIFDSIFKVSLLIDDLSRAANF